MRFALLCSLVLAPALQQPGVDSGGSNWVRKRSSEPMHVSRSESGFTWSPPRGTSFGLPIVVGDLDGDGADDVLVTVTESLWCGNDTPMGSVRAISSATGKVLGLLGGLAEFRADPGERVEPRVEPFSASSLELLVLRTMYPQRSTLVLRMGFEEDAVWSLAETEAAVGVVRVSALLGDVDGDGMRDVAVGDAWRELESRTEWSDPPWVGVVSVLSGRDRRPLWTRKGTVDGEGYGMDLARAGDLDRDGVPDVAVLVSSINGLHDTSRIEVRSGDDGDELALVELPGRRPFRMSHVGDVDGDGIAEILADGAIVSLGAERLLDVTEGEPLSWAAGAGDVDRDRRQDLYVGRMDASGDREMGLYTAAGWTAMEFLPAEDLDWDGAGATSGDFDGDGVLDLMLVASEHDRSGLYSNVIRVHSGELLR